MPALNPVSWRDLPALLLLLLVAAWLRLGEPGMVEFLHDEAMLSLLAQEMAAGQRIPLTGIPSSVGIPNPPISVYIMAIPFSLSPDPAAATLFIAALNVAGVGLLWLLAQRYLGRLAALAAGLAYAANPWAVYYSRKIWAQDFQMPFLLLALLLGLHGFLEGKRWAQALFLPALCLALQIHFAAWALLPAAVWLVWSGRHQIAGKALAAGILLAALAVAPFAAGLAQTLTADPGRLNALLNRAGAGLSLTPDALLYTAQMATGLGLEAWFAPAGQAHLLAAAPPPTPLWALLGGLALAGLIGLWVVPAWRPLAVTLALWALLPTLVFTPTWTPAYPHYFIAALPVLAVLTGAGATWLAKRLPGRHLLLIIPTAALLTQAWWWQNSLRYLDTTFTPGGFGTPLHYLKSVQQAIGPERDVLIITDGIEILYDQEPAIWTALLHGSASCVRALTGDGRAVFPAGRFAVLIAPNAPPGPVSDLYTTPAEQGFALRPGEGTYRLNRFESAPAWPGPPLAALSPSHFEGGAALTGYALAEGRLYLEWRLPGTLAKDFHYFAHFLNAAGDKLGQRDDLLWPGRFGCPGDRLITWTAVDMPPETTTLRVGLYTLASGGFANAAVVDEAGSPVGTWVDVPIRAG